MHGLIIVEGFNHVINLDNLGIPALGIVSNRINEAQVEKVTRRVRQLANNRVTLVFDNDEAGVQGAKDARWMLGERRIDIRLIWSRAMFGSKFKRQQPESVQSEDWEALAAWQ